MGLLKNSIEQDSDGSWRNRVTHCQVVFPKKERDADKDTEMQCSPCCGRVSYKLGGLVHTVSCI